jgi:hypothetical protein
MRKKFPLAGGKPSRRPARRWMEAGGTMEPKKRLEMLTTAMKSAALMPVQERRVWAGCCHFRRPRHSRRCLTWAI